MTVTSANGLNITHSVDSAGSGTFNLITTTAIVNNADGSTAETQTDSANNGAKLGQTVTTVSADGLTTTTQADSTGNGVFNQTQVDQTTVDGSGNRTRTITEASANGTVYAKQVIVLNADGKTGSTNDYVNYGSGLVLTRNVDEDGQRLRRARRYGHHLRRQWRGDRPDRDHHQRQWPCRHDAGRSERRRRLRLHHHFNHR